MKELQKLIELSNHNHKIDVKRGEKKFLDPHWVLDSILSEVEEVRDEIKPDNIHHLEDEVADILWGWMVLVENLKAREYLSSHEAIIKKALTKYEERVLSLEGNQNDHAIWAEVKRKQKEGLEKKSS